MATTQQKPVPQKKSEGFTGVRGAFWIIVVCAAVAFALFYFWFGNQMHFQDGAARENPADVWGTIFKGGAVFKAIQRSMDIASTVSKRVWITGTTAPPLKIVPQTSAGFSRAAPSWKCI